jgi:hypothetical protein
MDTEAGTMTKKRGDDQYGYDSGCIQRRWSR